MILFLSAYPPRECGMAAYSYQLLAALNEHFDSRSLSFSVCALEEEGAEKRLYSADVRYTLNTASPSDCREMAQRINNDKGIQAVCILHRFGLWGGDRWGENIQHFISELEKPLAVALHNVLPEPEQALTRVVQRIGEAADLLIVQTHYQAMQLEQHYGIAEDKIRIIPPGAPVASPFNKEELKKKHKLDGRLVLASFGYLRRSKGIEHVLEAVDLLRQEYPEIIYLILGRTHPTAARFEGERYRIQLKDLIFKKGLQKHVRFVNRHLETQELQEFMCLSDAYLHASKTNLSSLVLASTCGVPVIAAESPVTQEILQDNSVAADFSEPRSIANAISESLVAQYAQQNGQEGEEIGNHPYIWPNIALAYQEVFAALVPMQVRYKLPVLKPDHMYRLTTSVGLSNIDMQSKPPFAQAYLLKDNAKALVAALLWYHYEPSQELLLLMLMRRYLSVIRKCQQADGTFLSQLDEQGDYMPEAQKTLSEECSMQAMWALSELIKMGDTLPADMPQLAKRLFKKGMPHVANVTSLRAAAFAIKALSLYQESNPKESTLALMTALADKLKAAYQTVATEEFPWFEPSLGVDNSLLPEAMLLAWQASGQLVYKKIAHRSFQFLLGQMFGKLSPADDVQDLPYESEESFIFSNRPQEISFAILALNHFYQQTGEQAYVDKMFSAFSWFMGNNELHQTLYNPATGGCYDGLRNGKISQHQGAECLVSYLLSRLPLEKYTIQAFVLQTKPTPAAKRLPIRGVEAVGDRPSMASGHVKMLAN